MEKKGQSVFQSFNCAIQGFIYVLRTQRNMRVHFMVGAVFLLGGIYLNFTSVEMLLLCGAITFVLITEMFNTSVEHLVDLLSHSHHHLALVAKDVAAGAVFVASINAVIAGYLLFTKRLPFPLESGLLKVKQSPWHVTFICLIIVLVVSIMLKVFFHRGTPLRGGMPSGHSAMAFSVWTIIAFMVQDGLIVVLAFVLAFLVARSRMKEAVHSFWEVVAGSVLGVLLTVIVFQLLK